MRDNQTELQTVVVNEESPTIAEPQFDIDPPPDGGYGWVQVGVAFTINAFTWGQTAVSHYTPPPLHLTLDNNKSPTPSISPTTSPPTNSQPQPL